VGSAGASKEKGTLWIRWGTAWIDMEAHFVSSIPKGMDMIIGLDNNLTAVNLNARGATIGRHSFVFQVHEEVKTPEEKAAGGDKELAVLLKQFKKVFAGGDKYYPLSKNLLSRSNCCLKLGL
jgi:hypothetical protein